MEFLVQKILLAIIFCVTRFTISEFGQKNHLMIKFSQVLSQNLYYIFQYRSINTRNRWCQSNDWLGNSDQPLEGFSWKHGRDANTKGIVIWSDVFLHDAPNGEKLAIVVMDTQGLFECDTKANVNARIFGISTLISSIQVINLQHLIQEDQLESFNMAVSLSQMFMQKDKNSSPGGNEISKMFQKLVFLMRDVNWTDEKVGFGSYGGEIYLNETLAGDFESETASSVRQHLRESFDEIKCCLLPHPGKAVSNRNFDGSHRDLDKEFLTNLKEVIELILAPQNLTVKSIFGHDLTGREFWEHLKYCIKFFQSENLPLAESIFELIANQQGHAIMKNCVQTYLDEINKAKLNYMAETKDIFKSSLTSDHNTAKEKAMKEFRKVPKLEFISKKFEAKLDAKIDRLFHDWIENQLKMFDAKWTFWSHFSRDSTDYSEYMPDPRTMLSCEVTI